MNRSAQMSDVANSQAKPEDVFIALIEAGIVKLPVKFERLFKPYRQVKITSKGIRAENGQVILDLIFTNFEGEFQAKLLLLPVQAIDGQDGEFTNYRTAIDLIRELNKTRNH